MGSLWIHITVPSASLGVHGEAAPCDLLQRRAGLQEWVDICIAAIAADQCMVDTFKNAASGDSTASSRHERFHSIAMHMLLAPLCPRKQQALCYVLRVYTPEFMQKLSSSTLAKLAYVPVKLRLHCEGTLGGKAWTTNL